MTEPNQSQNAQSPHAANQPSAVDPAAQPPARTPVVVNQGPDPELSGRLTNLENTLRGLPESIVNSFREATQPAQPPANANPQPGSNNNPPAAQPSAPPPPGNLEQQTTGGTGAKTGSRFANWFFGK